MTLRARLVLSLAYVLLLAVVALAIPLAISVERRARSDFEARLGGQAQVIAASVSEALGTAAPGEALDPVVREYARELGGRVIVTDRRGVLVADSTRRPAPPEEYRSRPEVARALAGERVRLVRDSDELGGRYLFLAVPVLRGNAIVGVVRVSQPTEEIDDRVRRSWLGLTVIALLILLVGLSVAWALASSLARPLRGLAASAGRLGSGDLSARAAEEGPREAREVAAALNQMAADLDATLEAQRDFVANASHQLRTPLTGLRLRLESIAASMPPVREEAEAALREVDRLGALIEDLLRLARASARERAGRATDLGDCVRDAADRWSARAAERDQTIEVVTDGRALAWTDPADVSAALDNLLENALLHNPSGTRVRVETVSADGSPGVAVDDNGPGIPASDVPRVLERFYRGRGAQAPGTGLGLAIVREIADRWGGGVEIDSDEHGTRVTVRFQPVP